MAVTAYKFLSIPEAELQDTLEAQLALGFWVVSGGEGLLAAKNKGFAATAGRAVHVNGTKHYKLLFWDEDTGAPVDVYSALGVHESDMDAECAAALVAFPGALVHNMWSDAAPSGELTFDLIFYDFA